MILEWIIVGAVVVGWNLFLFNRMRKDEKK